MYVFYILYLFLCRFYCTKHCIGFQEYALYIQQSVLLCSCLSTELLVRIPQLCYQPSYLRVAESCLPRGLSPAHVSRQTHGTLERRGVQTWYVQPGRGTTAQIQKGWAKLHTFKSTIFLFNVSCKCMAVHLTMYIIVYYLLIMNSYNVVITVSRAPCACTSESVMCTNV